MNRRGLALGIRIGQELLKRVARWGTQPRWRGMAALQRELRRDTRAIASGAAGDTHLLEHIRADASSRLGYPRQPRGSQPPDANGILAQARQLLSGRWSVFELELDIGPGYPAWRSHPLTGLETSLDHFSMIAYTGAHLGGDVKYIWELNRHAELLRMAQGYHLSRDERLASRVVDLLRDWMERNPPNRGVNWVSALEVSFRSIAWCWIWRLTADSPAWTPSTFARFLWTTAQAAKYLQRYDSVHHSPNTHLTGEALGLVYIGSTFPQFRRADRWRRRGIRILVDEVQHQFLADGFHFERATGYHRYNLEFYLHALAIAERAGEKWGAAFVPALRRALDVTAALRMPDGDWPVLGDEDGGSAVRLWASSSRNQDPLLCLGAALLNDGRWLPEAEPADQSLAWWFDVAVPAATGEAQATFSFPAAGYFGVREQGTEHPWYCVVDAGPHGGDLTGHAHTDLGHVELALGSARILADPGCAIYASDPERREWYRSLSAHASLVVDDRQLARPRGPFGWAAIAPAPSVQLHDDGDVWSCTLSYPVDPGQSVLHERQVVVLRDSGVFIIDHVLGTGTHRLEWNWPLGVRLERSCGALTERQVEVGPAILSWHSTVATEGRLVQTTRSPTYGIEIPVTAVQVSASTSRPLTMVTSFRTSGTPAPLIACEQDGARVTTLDGLELIARPGTAPAIRPRGTARRLASATVGQR